MRNIRLEQEVRKWCRDRIRATSVRSRTAILHTVEHNKSTGEFLWADYTYRYGNRVYSVMLQSPRYVQLKRRWFEEHDPDRPVNTDVRHYPFHIDIDATINYDADTVARFLNEYFDSIRGQKQN